MQCKCSLNKNKDLRHLSLLETQCPRIYDIQFELFDVSIIEYLACLHV